MPKYRKKPVVINAARFILNDKIPNEKWLQDALQTEVMVLRRNHIAIRTLEGLMTASPGDWIIQGVKGEIYPCKPDIFEATYEEVV